jgi:hypothetical protein
MRCSFREGIADEKGNDSQENHFYHCPPPWKHISLGFRNFTLLKDRFKRSLMQTHWPLIHSSTA